MHQATVRTVCRELELVADTALPRLNQMSLMPEEEATHEVEHVGIAVELQPLSVAIKVATARVELIRNAIATKTPYDVLSFEKGEADQALFVSNEEKQYNQFLAAMTNCKRTIDAKITAAAEKLQQEGKTKEDVQAAAAALHAAASAGEGGGGKCQFML